MDLRQKIVQSGVLAKALYVLVSWHVAHVALALDG